ncbi:MAG TPA: hypothetical protein VNK04_20995 [Gemmataceae bacterium]|nr:hypothetical protein [Gemmataceae bacterium]
MRKFSLLVVLVAGLVLLGAAAPANAQTYSGTIVFPNGSLTYMLVLTPTSISYTATGTLNGQPCTITANATITISGRQVCINGTVTINCAGVTRNCVISVCGRTRQEALVRFVLALYQCIRSGG